MTTDKSNTGEQEEWLTRKDMHFTTDIVAFYIQQTLAEKYGPRSDYVKRSEVKEKLDANNDLIQGLEVLIEANKTDHEQALADLKREVAISVEKCVGVGKDWLFGDLRKLGITPEEDSDE